ncbi:hypothetical protein [Sulfurimonas sp.]|uniref:hypothetical protein n=1 Tax=Sulfurimonas sp. TaxID=2022749 RepID=UPI002B47AAD8|nr:hypothetical protein [Sulfurimonas sp.]
MISNFTVQTGTPRHVVGHGVSGAVAVGVISAIGNAKKVKENEKDKTEAIRDTLKDSLIGGIATATAISVANNLGDPRKSFFQTIGSLVLGAGAIYTIEKSAIYQKNKLITDGEK